MEESEYNRRKRELEAAYAAKLQKSKETKEKAKRGIEIRELEKKLAEAEYEGLTQSEKEYLRQEKERRLKIPKSIVSGVVNGTKVIFNVGKGIIDYIGNIGEDEKKSVKKKKVKK